MTRSSCVAGSSVPSKWRSASPIRTSGVGGSRSSSLAQGRRGRARGPARRAVTPFVARQLPTHRSGSGAHRSARRFANDSQRLSEALRQRGTRDLRDLGVEILLGTAVTGVDERGVETNSADPRLRRIEAATKIWAAGVQASPLGGMLAAAAGAELDRAGRVKVEPDCSLAGHPEVFVIGDLMSLDGLPGVSQVAIQSGRHAADTIRRRLAGDNTGRPFRYRDLGSMATISLFRALAGIGPARVGGFAAWVLWLVVHLAALIGFRNRLSVLFSWTVAFLGGGRAERVITRQQVFGRHAMAAQAPMKQPSFTNSRT